LRLTSAGSGVPALAPALEDMRAQLGGLIYPGFIADTGATKLPDLVRYLRAIGRRLDKCGSELAKDAERMTIVHQLSAEFDAVRRDPPAGDQSSPDVIALRWQLEELRVNLFAQVLGTPGPVSEKRIRSALDALGGA